MRKIRRRKKKRKRKKEEKTEKEEKEERPRRGYMYAINTCVDYLMTIFFFGYISVLLRLHILARPTYTGKPNRVLLKIRMRKNKWLLLDKSMKISNFYC